MRLAVYFLTCFAVAMASTAMPSSAQEVNKTNDKFEMPAVAKFIQQHCTDCHDSDSKTAGLDLEQSLHFSLGNRSRQWESVVRKLNLRQMPPADSSRPNEEEYRSTLRRLTSALDAAAQDHPVTGRTDTFRRLNRSEYQNAIRDLLDLELDVKELLPADESSLGFDNITVDDLSPTLMSRYISAAQKISRLAVGRRGNSPTSKTFRMRPDVTQDSQRVKGLPLGTRGGMLIPFNFPQDGEYEIKVRLMRDRNDEIEGLRGKHELEILVDRKRKAKFTVEPPPRGKSDQVVEAKLKSRIDVIAGPHKLGVTFFKKPTALIESETQPLNVHYNFYRHPRLGPAVYQVSITGPFNPKGAGDTPSRRRIFWCRPEDTKDEIACAKKILGQLTRRAYRRPVKDSDLRVPMKFFEIGRRDGGFEAGIERALAALLVNPNFLFRIERQPLELKKNQPYQINNSALASRLSFFLWSSIPDEELLNAAEQGELGSREILERQVRRMLADKRSDSLVTNFADQWLYLRNLESFTPDSRLYPDFGHNLRQAFRRETELLFEEVIREDKSVTTLLNSKATYLNERLAKHYGIPKVYGSHFRRVLLDQQSQRGGILRHGSILSVTSHAMRTSPVIRGKWILENLLGSPPPPPPPDIPALEDNTVDAKLPVRERLAVHRANAACAVCHDQIDPIGFGLENFDAVGRWRVLEQNQPVIASGKLPDGSQFVGVGGLEQALLNRPELFVQTLTEKLMTFALGRGLEYHDAPAIRKIIRDAKVNDYRFSSLIVGIVKSQPFQTRMAEVREPNQ